MVTVGKAEVPLTTQGEKLFAKYADMLTAFKAEIAASGPSIDKQKKVRFLAAHAAVANVPVPPNPNGLKNAPPRQAEPTRN